jgi:type I restriction enzyme S subunit
MAPSVLRHSLDLIEMAPHKAGTGQPYIRMESLFSSEITVPDLETSAVIAPVLDGLSELEARSSEENTTLATTRDALLPQLMSGKIRVKDAEKILEVAGV